MRAEKVILQFSCPDKPGILAAVTQFLSKNDAFMTEVSSFSANDTNRFFNRIAFQKNDSKAFDLEDFESRFLKDLKEFDIDCNFYNAEVPCRTVIAVSKYSHCLNDIIHRWEIDALPIDIKAIISNHDDARSFSEWNKIPYHYLPVSSETKKDQEKLFKDIIRDNDAELVILARYMQILSPEFLSGLKSDCINIHHSFLPGFKGAKPYHQAHERGVKIIGATAHYVTDDLDEGPIIEQDIRRVDHSTSPESMQQSGYDIESSVLLRAVRLYSERRIMLNGIKTVVFN
ncbi:MAG: formyltetrahydrofolate deformylase [Alphaproteobacteria bacterium]|jgi:formyltetrahydrofolate deformylase|nr:formyltetrahydrofolate deformylase [Alphaproteobacteria bacterium]